MDPNWFYSSLAQSAAAIVAIISAILFSKIQDLRKNGSENHNKLNNKIDDWTKLKNEIKKTFLEYQSYEPFQRPPMPWDNIKNFNIDVEILNIIHNNEKYIEIENMMQEFLQEYDRLYLSKKDNMGEESLHHVINFKDDEEIINKIIGWWIYTNNLIKDIKNHNKMVSPNILNRIYFL